MQFYRVTDENSDVFFETVFALEDAAYITPKLQSSEWLAFFVQKSIILVGRSTFALQLKFV
jgi:hypothetical protein